MKVYVATTGEYEDYKPIAVFDNEQDASDYEKLGGCSGVLEFELNKELPRLAQLRDGLRYYQVSYKSNKADDMSPVMVGGSESHMLAFSERNNYDQEDFIYFANEGFWDRFQWIGLARSSEEAVIKARQYESDVLKKRSEWGLSTYAVGCRKKHSFFEFSVVPKDEYDKFTTTDFKQNVSRTWPRIYVDAFDRLDAAEIALEMAENAPASSASIFPGAAAASTWKLWSLTHKD